MGMQGKRILITRTRQQASALAARLTAEGAETILIPTIELAPPVSFCGLDAALASVRTYAWVIFTSANAVQAFAARARQMGVMPSPRRVAVIGPATARAVAEAGLTTDLMPAAYVAESLAEALVPYAAGASMLLVRGEQARDVVPDVLTAAGAEVTVATAYRNVIPQGSVAALQELFAEEGRWPDAVTFTSGSTATNLFALLEAAGMTLPRGMARASIGPVTSRTLEELGYPATVEAEEATIDSLCAALAAFFRER